MIFRMIRNSLFLLMFASFLFIEACSTVSTKDGPPPFDVDVSKIPDAVPKNEPVSKYGNNPTYKVFGKTYHVLPTSKNYDAQGIASWYGTKFHARHTSNGERYDMLGMTAAHKTLPLPTYAQVTNLRNGKKVIVKINDRGPFEANRLIDLSYVAAKKLGMLGHGTAMVDVKAIDPNNWPTRNDVYIAQSNTHHHNRGNYIQLGAFRNRIYAEKLKNKLTTYINSPIRIVRLSRTSLYHVEIGPLGSVSEREHINKKLKMNGLV